MAGGFAELTHIGGKIMESGKRIYVPMIRKPTVWLALIFMITVTACASVFRVLELRETGSFNVQQTNLSPVTLKLSGLALHSALVVRDIKLVQKGDTTQVLVRLVLVSSLSSGLSGGFEYEYVVPPDVNSVTFGKEKTLIWSREEGLVQQE